MTSITKYACAFVLAGGLASSALDAQNLPAGRQGDAGSGPTTGATSTNDAGSGPTRGATVNSESPRQHGQSEANANPAAVNPGSPIQKGETETNANSATGGARIAQKLRADLSKAGYTNITVMPSAFLVRAQNSEGSPVVMLISPDSVTALTEATQGSNSTSHSAGVTPGPSSTGGSQPVTPGSSHTAD